MPLAGCGNEALSAFSSRLRLEIFSLAHRRSRWTHPITKSQPTPVSQTSAYAKTTGAPYLYHIRISSSRKPRLPCVAAVQQQSHTFGANSIARKSLFGMLPGTVKKSYTWCLARNGSFRMSSSGSQRLQIENRFGSINFASHRKRTKLPARANGLRKARRARGKALLAETDRETRSYDDHFTTASVLGTITTIAVCDRIFAYQDFEPLSRLKPSIEYYITSQPFKIPTYPRSYAGAPY